MGRSTRRVDAVLVALMRRAGMTDTALEDLIDHFRASSGRIGYVVSASWFTARGDDALDVDSVDLLECGTLSCKHMGDDPAYDWHHGTLSLWSRQMPIPASLVPSLPGRVLGTVVALDPLPPDAEILSVLETGNWIRLECAGWSVGVKEALDTLKG